MARSVLRYMVVAAALLGSVGTAYAGRGSSPGAIQGAIASGSVEAIESELERAEGLVCHVCVQLVRPLIDHEDARVRRVAAWWLARRGLRPELSLEMVQRLSAPDSRLARNAADVLGQIRAYKSIPALGAALNNPVFNTEARAAMARALGAIGDKEGQAALMVAMKAPEGDVRAAALEGVRQLRGYDDPAVGLAPLDDADENVRVQAIYTIAMTRSMAARSPALDALARKLAQLVATDASELVRKKAAWALGEIGASASVAGAALERAATSDASPFVKSLATAALAKLSR